MFQVFADANKIITSGTSWLTDIVKRLSSFARLNEAEFETLDMQEDIEDILLLVQHELKNKTVVERHYGLLPPFSCKSRQLNQVFLNLIINTVQAIEDHDTFSISTFAEKNIACVRIRHTGVGIPPEYLQKNFDPGFPT